MGHPVWFLKKIVPVDEFEHWKAWYDMQWEECTPQSYEFGLLRQSVYGAFGGTPPNLDRVMLPTLVKEMSKDWKDRQSDLADQWRSARQSEKRKKA